MLTLDNGRKINVMVRANSSGPMEISTKDLGSTIKNKATVSI